MKELICGMIAALIAYGCNKLLLRWQGDKAIIYTVPLVEEVSKSLTAYFISGGLILTHIIFGIIEALYDLIHTKSEKVGFIAAIMSIVSHGIFGILTAYLYKWTGMILLSIFITAISHSLWNYFITK
ncbi:hypothetical protein NSA47_08465 [Irregularibacter muris]|uniref:Uncharacterized protein n=1 Tax=Irregularibacter muris TaxID=1796619 RepID=A0AAE3HGG8_9FIRM|nr:hypothetical protein [Irregularibacter muris]MCR1899017.1 hypothetical protein [Irregularibacter muris]